MFLKNTRQYCKEKGYEFVWFCKDIEQVYIGKRVADKDKKKEAAKFKADNRITGVEGSKLRANNYRINMSNILKILGNYNEFIPKK